MNINKIFISYSWDSETHKKWTKMLADKLEEFFEIHVTLDQYDLDSFSDKNYFMEKGVFENDIVLVVITSNFSDKANNRVGGVGIETKMASARHWEESLKDGSSKVIPILRENTNLPNYLKEKFYIDFCEDDYFEASFKILIDHIKGNSKSLRPEKKHSLSRPPLYQNLTRVEDFLKINYKKRNLVFDKQQSTDYSQGHKVKFELWKTISPSIQYFLFLFDNISIKDTINKICALLKSNLINLSPLTVLKKGKSDSGYLKGLFSENGFNIEITELTYDEYIWDYCIDDKAKSDSGIYITPNFIDQSLMSCDEKDDYGLAFEYIKSQLNDKSQPTINVIIAPGGTGKTTLCQSLAKHCQSTHLIPVFLQSEEIKLAGVNGFILNKKIETVYDLYETFANTCIKNDEEFVFDRVTFELALLTGRLVLIIDGLDEFISLFPEGFDLNSFFKSIDELNKELASSKVILTTRNDVFSDEMVSEYSNTNKYKILGFDNKSCERYLKKRFRGYPNNERMTKKVISNIEPLISKDQNERILPFIVDLISSLVEGTDDVEHFNFELSFVGKDYESNSDITDYLVYSILRRESVRQAITISIHDILDIFLEFATNYNDGFPKSAFEELVSTYYTEDAENLTKKLLRNPLIKIDGDFCRFKYDFIYDYLRSIYIIHSINKKSKSEDFIKLVARFSFEDSPVFKDVYKYYEKKQSVFIECAKVIVESIKKELTPKDVFGKNDYKFKAISFFVNLTSALNKNTSKDVYTDIIKSIFGNQNTLYYISIYGNSKPLDFSNVRVFYSRFVGYKNFTSSKFENSMFSNCHFENISNTKSPENISSNMFDSCQLGDLQNIIESVSTESQNSREIIEKELRLFFNSFFRRGKFTDQKKLYIKFPDRVSSINDRFFNILLQKKILEIKLEKSDETYYIISSSYQKSIYSFLNDNSIDKDMNEIIDLAI